METVKNQTLPERVGKKWEIDEEVYVLKRISQGANYMTIASECQRKVGGISSHLHEMACRFIKEGKPMEEVVQITGLLEDDIKDAIQRRQVAERMKAERESMPKETVQKSIKAFMPHLIKPKPVQDDMMTVLIEIRDLLKQLVEDKKN